MAADNVSPSKLYKNKILLNFQVQIDTILLFPGVFVEYLGSLELKIFCICGSRWALFLDKFGLDER